MNLIENLRTFSWTNLKMYYAIYSGRKKPMEPKAYDLILDGGNETIYFTDYSPTPKCPQVFSDTGSCNTDTYFIIAEETPHQVFSHSQRNTDYGKAMQLDQKVFSSKSVDLKSLYDRAYKFTSFRTILDVLVTSRPEPHLAAKSECPNLFVKYHEFPEVIAKLDVFLNHLSEDNNSVMFKRLPAWAQEYILNSNLF